MIVLLLAAVILTVSIGDLTDDKSLKNEGKVDRGTGKVKDAAGSVSDKVKDVVNPDRR